mgnify:CR=1 FL=1
METKQFLKELVEMSGISGQEAAVAQKIAKAFEPYCDDVRIDSFFNVYGKKTDMHLDGAPRIMLAAHMDEIGLMVRDIDENGFIKFTNVGGVDQRVLLSQEVIVHGKEDLFGVIGAKPPHLQNPGDEKKAVKMKDMSIDVGLPADKVKELVEIGDPITFLSPLVDMQGSYVNGKALDDRASVAVLLETMKELSRIRFSAEIYFVATVQEEVGTRGAVISTYQNRPDIGIAIDVTHGDTPDASKDDTVSMDKGPTIAIGPNMHPKLTQRLMDIADEYGIGYTTEVAAGPTGTDARSMQISRAGVPTVLLEIPLRYMHTPVETLNMETVKKAARILAAFIASMKEGWEEWLTY